MGALSESDVAGIVAMPGYLIVEIEREQELTTAGGVVIPVMPDDKKQQFPMKMARVLSCGPYYSQQSGMSATAPASWQDEGGPEYLHGSPRLRWPLPQGTRICFHPHSPWPVFKSDGREIHAIKCVDVMAVLP